MNECSVYPAGKHHAIQPLSRNRLICRLFKLTRIRSLSFERVSVITLLLPFFGLS